MMRLFVCLIVCFCSAVANAQVSIRLVDGSSSNEGRVEVNYNGQWGTVCDDLWDDTDAAVVCQILGLGETGSALGSAAFGQGSGDIILDNVECVGTETDLFSCPSNGPLSHNCGHSEDAGVQCISTPSVSIRLVDGSSSNEGRVEVNYNGQWGTVCDDLWDDTDAAVVCQILGLGETGSALSNAAFGQGSGDIILDNVECVGTETDLFSCPSNGPLSHNCGHSEDAGVQCFSTPSVSIRLVDGSSSNEGRVEVNYNGQWGTVCDDLWDDTDAAVVCQILGLGETGSALSNAAFGQGSGDIILDNVECVGTETDLFSCPSNGPLNHNCGHSEDAGVQCISTPSVSIRLVDGSSSNEGRVEVNYNGQWGTVCDDLWDDTDAAVVCQILGLGETGSALSNAAFGQGSGDIILDNVECVGTETDLFSCPSNGPLNHNCGHSEDAGVQCISTPSVSIRLVDGSSSNEGRVEVNYNGQWGTVCDDLWDDTDAAVVCQILGLGESGSALGSAAFGQGSGDIILDNVECVGTETDLFSCPSNGPLSHNCGHGEDAGVQCISTPSVSIRLVDGSSSNEGRVEVNYNGQWGTVCDDLWDDTDAAVVCQILGLGESGSALSNAAFGQGSGDIILDNVECVGTETDLFSCPNNGPLIHNCGHGEDAGVQCSSTSSVSIRLVDGSSSNEGRVEVNYNGQWGTVCDDLWDDTDAAVVCQILGLGDTGSALSNAAFGQGSGDIILDNVECVGTETDLFSCPNNGPLIHNCGHGEDAGVQCSSTPSASIRLVDGSSNNEGRVEVNYNGQWGTVCDDLWDDTDATVVCQILGLGETGSALGSAAFGQGSGDIILDNVECVGTETDLFSCPSNGPLSHNCGHGEDAGVQCSSTPSASLRLVDGSSSNEGRVEVNYNGQWGTVCDDLWDDTDAAVVCQILGLGESGSALGSAAFGPGSGDIILDNVECVGTETDLFSCPSNGPLSHNCGHGEDAGVQCSGTPSVSIRLVDGSSSNEGRVEVNYNGQWGTVCDDFWDDTDAAVVCQILGLGESGSALGSAAFGEGSGDIILDDVQCVGTETDLFSCPNNGPLNHNCGHGEDAGVQCISTSSGAIRLVDGSSSNEGRVEVNYNGQWGTVCDDLWDDTDATVVCQILGLGETGSALGSAAFGEGSGDIILDNVQCVGTETDLFSCPSNGPLSHNCGHGEDAGVQCSSTPSVSIRLVDGSSSNEGRVEVNYNGQWGTVCDDFWDDTDAAVVCQILGLGESGSALGSAAFGEGSGDIILDDVQCVGTETDLFSCPNNGPLNHNCGHREDAGVQCISTPSGAIRLVDGSSSNEGRVEINYNGQWGTVCDDLWDDTDAAVVCQILGLGETGSALGSAAFGEGSGDIILDNVQCVGTETDLFSCPSNGPLSHNCVHAEDAGVQCISTSSASIRLVDGSSSIEGRVEVNYNGQWGTVCDDYWDDTDATVVCQILGLGESGSALGSAAFGQGSGDIILDNVQCVGTETDLFSCPSNAPLSHNCVHAEDAGVQCISTSSGAIRLVDGSSSNEGRVEVNYNGQWGTVCDDLWDDTDAAVVCQILGLGESGSALGSAAFGPGSGDIILDNVQCVGTETDLFSCPSNGPLSHNCGHSEDAGVQCTSTPSVSIRLVDGSSSNEGRVEVNYNGQWGTVCDDFWDDTDAAVVCQILGLGESGSALGSAAFGQGIGDIILDDVQCVGTETDLFSCPNNGPLSHNCGHGEDAGVRCISTSSGAIRLVDGSSSNEGRVEINYNGQWGTVCDDQWDDTDARVVCQILGIGETASALGSAAFGEGSGDIILDNVQCTGTESNLFSCPSNGPLSHNCVHAEDAGVQCGSTSSDNSSGYPFGYNSESSYHYALLNVSQTLGAIRLVDGSSGNEGRVEIEYNGQWGTVCDDLWDDTDATVVCQILGLGESGSALRNAAFGQGSGDIILDDVQCVGTETDLFSCPSNGPLSHNCVHAEDAGVRCISTSSESIRLVGGQSINEGRVEVRYDGQWGTVCDDLWDDADAAVVCRALGFGDTAAAIGQAMFGEGTNKIVLDNVECLGNEADLFACPSNGPLIHDCRHYEDAGVLCYV
ncbi:deleted in malignant brain tumors 1 protein-like isoform X7 [Strongylocentrotus purpuratus]|uniref:SRCR domain-containing protein n=1 Tax=Strongylocentrotus purpuratus TaxID=7668 RepID=A0A7M7P9C3_STRPU|nr:deleted in malignant brain tumors 1 protein-like isoform X7 [Strongylocentrotus purpuratus]